MPMIKHRLIRVDEFPPGSRTLVAVGKRTLGIFNLDGRYYALPNLCPHQLGPLCEGKISGTTGSRAENEWRWEWIHEGEIITCPWHGIEYHIPTGRCLPLREKSIRTRELEAEDGWIILEMEAVAGQFQKVSFPSQEEG
jgi:nitrite reductase/ring-hydroxylating ferredoxin subunit